MTIIIPSRLVLDKQNSAITLGETIRLDSSDIGSTSSPMFRLMVKFLLNPVSSGSYNNVERNLSKYLDYEFMQEASEETSDMEYDEAEYKKYVNDAYKLLSEMDIQTFLDEHVKPKLSGSRIANFSQSDLDAVIRNLGNEELPMKDYLTSSGFNKIMGTRKTGDKSRKIRNIAESKAMYEDALDEIDDYIEISEIKRGEKKGGAGGYLTTVDGVTEERPATIIEYKIVIDTEKMFKDIFEDAGIEPRIDIRKAEATLEDVIDDYSKSLKDDSYNLEINPDMPTLEDLRESGFDFIWFPKDLVEKALKDSELAEKIIKINMKLIWNEDRKEYEGVPFDALDDKEKELLLLLYNTNIIKVDSLYKYVTNEIVPSNRNLNQLEKKFLKEEIEPRAKKQDTEPSFENEFEQELWSKINDKVRLERKMDIILHAPDESKHNETKLFVTPINYNKLKVNGKEGLLSVKRNDSSKEFHSIIKQILSPNDIGIHTLTTRVIQVDDPYVKLAESYLNKPTMPSGGSSADNKKRFKELLDETWNVFRLIDAEYKSKGRPFLSNITEITPQKVSKPERSLTDVDYDRMDKPLTRPGKNPPTQGQSRVKEGGQVALISVQSRVFNSSLKRQLRKLRRYLDE